VVDRLAQGQQPDPARIDEVGYLMRTTAVYGSGKFGAADHNAMAGRPLMDGPFRVEMLTVWLIRAFVADLVEHMAAPPGRRRAVRLDPDLRRALGIGNATGLGMAPFLVNHPDLLNNWITARETAIARVRALPLARRQPRWLSPPRSRWRRRPRRAGAVRIRCNRRLGRHCGGTSCAWPITSRRASSMGRGRGTR
jgi:hypothetical protein